MPGLLYIQKNTYIELQMSSKQKIAVIEEESKSKNNKEDTYMANDRDGLYHHKEGDGGN
ncbi:uncharacterized protein F5891DRAFT_1183592 [Suillus fuscotomentosus]|uniref:Uncharacterized protein n=1 Tax=Suillus fuscotomentosus TaxID=1912939 RepID=A0AAD4HQ71_9AGAM|nr:uncharacterized protein F5891DRAFT_1183592 [Suillus fuscotomentosus]KAG1904948.1 hypothetical protein F5891DRAFT_1183592 [Suillus fuscotomentosus]